MPSRVAIVLAALVGAALCAPTAANAAPGTTSRAIGQGTAAAGRIVDASRLPQRLPAAAGSPARTAPQPDARAALPSRPTTGRRATAVAASTAGITPKAVASVATSFDGATGSNCTHCGQPSDVNAAVGQTTIAEATNVNIDVFTKSGAGLCHIAYSDLLGTTDNLTDPRIVYDNIFGRFVTVVIVVPAASTDPVAIWVAVTQQPEAPCGSWFTYRVTLNSAAASPGDLLDYPFLALDANSILISGNKRGAAALFGIPKSAAYNGNGFNFPVFTAVLNTVPVTSGGTPMRGNANTYFLAAIPGTGYNLYRMTNSAGPNTSFNLQATIKSSYNAPTRRVNQPGTTSTLDPQGGQIEWSPVLAANNLIWFTHGVDDAGFPTVRYGAVNVTNNTVQVNEAYHSSNSDDFNPSISVGDSPGTGTVFLNWAFTDVSAGVATSATVTSVASTGGSLPALIGSDTVLVTGVSTGQTRFGDLSSVTIDPSVPGGTCALTAQQYFESDWNTRIARVGNC